MRRRLHLLPLMLLIMAGAFPSADGAAIRYIHNPHNGNMMSDARIEILGEIQRDDAKKLPAIIKRAIENSRKKQEGRLPYEWNPWVIIDSPGGDVIEAMKIGRLLREARAAIMITPGASCASACVLVLAGGVNRFSFGEREQVRIGVHRMRPTDPAFLALPPAKALEEYDRVKREVAKYLDEMGIARGLYDHMFNVSSRKIEWLSRAQADSYLLLGQDPAYAEWHRANLVAEKGADWVRRHDAYIDCLNRISPNNDVEFCKAETGHSW